MTLIKLISSARGLPVRLKCSGTNEVCKIEFESLRPNVKMMTGGGQISAFLRKELINSWCSRGEPDKRTLLGPAM